MIFLNVYSTGMFNSQVRPQKNRFMEITLLQAKQLTTPYFQDEAKNCTDLV